MIRKIESILICTLLIATVIVNIPTNSNIKASRETVENNNYDLDYVYMNDQTTWIGEVIHNEYKGKEIRKGRAFATKGGHATEDHIYEQLGDIMGLKEVEKEQIGPLWYKPTWYYSNKLETIDYRLRINHPDYGFSSKVPKNETFPFPSALEPNQNYTFDGVRVYRYEDLPLTKKGLNDDYYNVSYEQVETNFAVVGNTSYIPLHETLPEDQEGMVFIINESEGCESKLDNATNASGVILIHETYNATTSNCSASVVRVPHNDTNLTEVLNLLENGTMMMVSNVNSNETLTFEPVTGAGDRCWPSYNYMALVESKGSDIWKTLGIPYVRSILFRYNPFNPCQGFIVYDNKTNEYKGTHIMGFSTRTWRGYPWWKFPFKCPKQVPGLPIFSVNYTVGKFLHDTCYDTDDVLTITGSYLNQRFVERNFPNTPGVEAHNVVGKIYSDKNPDEVTIISGRPDGWWGETPSDSGASGAIVLTTAKYMKKLETEYEIKPKINITFLFTTGEEYGMRGAYHYRDKYICTTNFERWLGLDQLGWDEYGQKLGVFARDVVTQKVVEAVNYATDYEGRTSYEFECIDASEAGGSEDVVWKEEIDTVCFVKDPTDYTCYNYHRSGEDFTEGDCLNRIDRNDLNVTLELFWAITKYFCYDPVDCLFEGDVTYQAIDSDNDGDTLADSIKATFRLNTSFPAEKVMIKSKLKKQQTGNSVGTIIKIYSITTEGKNCELIFPIPDNQTTGDYKLEMELYNFTGMIDEISKLDPGKYDDSDVSTSSFTLYHPFGNPRIGSNSQQVGNRITGSTFKLHEDCVVDNITAYIYAPTIVPARKSKCLIYRKSDSQLIGESNEYGFGTGMFGAWKRYEFSNPPQLSKNTWYVLVCWGETGVFLYYDDFNQVRGRYQTKTYGTSTPNPANFNTENRLYSLYCSYSPQQPTSDMTFYFNDYNSYIAWETNPAYMVDGNATTSAKTTVDGDVELCNNNTCDSFSSDIIEKVELRVASYYDFRGGQRDTILQPVFHGFIDGDEYVYETHDNSTIAWSPWFDITNDSSAPPFGWTWIDIVNLDCKVKAEYNPFGLPFTLFCSKVEMRVTYTT